MKKIPFFVSVTFKICIVHLVLFFMTRLAFVLANLYWFGNTNPAAGLIVESYIVGIRFDTAVLCSIFLIPFTLLFFHTIFQISILEKIAKVILKIILPITLLLACADIPYYIQFQKHITGEDFGWMRHGATSLELVFSDFNYWGYLLLFIPLAYTSIKTTSVFFRKSTAVNSEWKPAVASFLIAGSLLFLGVRGRIAKTPIHPGVAYISENMLVNQAGLNANFTLMYSWFFPKAHKEIFGPANDLSSLEKAKKYLNISGNEFERVIKQSDTVKKLNVVVVLMESMSGFKTGHFHKKVLTPELLKIMQNGFWFSNFYSAGSHTYNGIFSTITGYPAILHEHALENYVYKKFNCLPSNLKALGYHTSFFVSHDEQFDNMSGFLKYNGIDNIYSDKDFPSSASLGPMGVPDHLLFEFAVQKIGKVKQPFFSLLLTSSDHGPWEIPEDIPFKPSSNDEQERATQYADWSIGRFIESVKKEKWFDNTLFVFLGDHGSNHGKTYHMDLAFSHVPCVFYCPKYLSPQKFESPALQIDVFPTIMGMLGYGYANHSMGMNLLNEKRKYAFFSQDDRIGCLDDSNFYFNLLYAGGKEYLIEYKELNDTNFITQKKPHADSLKNYMQAMFQAGNYLLTNKKY